MSGEASNFVLDLLDRPNEPVFTPKGDNGVVFNVPDDYLEDRFKGADVSNRFGSGSSERVQVKPITLPDLSLPESLNKDDQFSLFLPRHRKCAGRLIEIFMGMRTTEDFLSCATYCRSKMNSLMFNYAMSVAILHRPDLKHIDLPPLCSYFPDKYMDGKIFRKAREEVNLNFQIDNLAQVPIELPLDYTASDLEEEHRVAYFREDLGINLHHWHWHLVYPFSGTREVVNKDRRGELFYYMHQQILARYNAERLCNKLPRTTRLLEFRQPLKEGYFPKLDSLTASRTWASRPPNAVLQDIRREAEEITFDIQDLERWKDRILEVAHTGRYKSSDGQSVALTPETGIDVLGNLIEASVLSPNPNLYGDLHNFGHIAIALVHDPEFRHLETFSVMGDSATAMRDPVFYRWHAFIDDIFQEYKQTLPQYTAPQLDFDQVRVTGLEINSPNNPKNQIGTFWKQDDVDLVRGMDFTPRGNVYTRFTHLQHTPFEYTITVNNSGPQRRGTVRIFLGPKLDERGVPYLYTEQRKLMIELDKFDFDLKPNQNVIKRRSPQSSVIIPFERTFRNLNAAPTTQDALGAFNFCGCGWPEHMLIPKGTVEGFPCVLFVMISNFQDDRVEGAGGTAGDCSSASSYCGVRNSKYPDRRPMGYPFDRLPRRGVDTIQQFLTGNMRVQDVIIKFNNRVVPATPLPNRPK